jgi:hypothetical protein
MLIDGLGRVSLNVSRYIHRVAHLYVVLWVINRVIETAANIAEEITHGFGGSGDVRDQQRNTELVIDIARVIKTLLEPSQVEGRQRTRPSRRRRLG